MILNEEELTIVKEQVKRLEQALESLEGTIRPKSEKNFHIFSEGHVDLLKELRDEIAAYEHNRDVNGRAAFRTAAESSPKEMEKV